MIEFKDVTKRYPDGTVAVNGLSLQAPSNKITVFVGPSGCGKTTSLRMINRTIDRTAGVISIDGRDINDGDPVALRRGIGYVIQHAGLFPHRTVLDNVATVPRLLGWDRAKTRTVAMELLERVGLDPKLAKCRRSSSGCSARSARRSCSSRTTSTRRSSSATTSRC